jgi:glutamine synthetase
MGEDLARIARDGGIRYFLISFTDLFGVVRSKLVPAAAIGEMQKAGAGFATSARRTPTSSPSPTRRASPSCHGSPRSPGSRAIW